MFDADLEDYTRVRVSSLRQVTLITTVTSQ